MSQLLSALSPFGSYLLFSLLHTMSYIRVVGTEGRIAEGLILSVSLAHDTAVIQQSANQVVLTMFEFL